MAIRKSKEYMTTAIYLYVYRTNLKDNVVIWFIDNRRSWELHNWDYNAFAHYYADFDLRWYAFSSVSIYKIFSFKSLIEFGPFFFSFNNFLVLLPSELTKINSLVLQSTSNAQL